MSETATRIIGVDFSGAAKDNHVGKTWITEGTLQGNSLTLLEPRPISRNCLTEMLIKEDPKAVIAMDFPFSVPREFLDCW